MKELETIYKNERRYSTWKLSQVVGRRHTSLLNLCKNFKKEIMEFEDNKKNKDFIVHKIIKKTAGQPVKEYLLNSGQMFFLGLLLRARGEDKVLDFKFKLIKEYFEQKDQLKKYLNSSEMTTN